jgi:hypothetical protein
MSTYPKIRGKWGFFAWLQVQLNVCAYTIFLKNWSTKTEGGKQTLKHISKTICPKFNGTTQIVHRAVGTSNKIELLGVEVKDSAYLVLVLQVCSYLVPLLPPLVVGQEPVGGGRQQGRRRRCRSSARQRRATTRKKVRMQVIHSSVMRDREMWRLSSARTQLGGRGCRSSISARVLERWGERGVVAAGWGGSGGNGYVKRYPSKIFGGNFFRMQLFAAPAKGCSTLWYPFK